MCPVWFPKKTNTMSKGDMSLPKESLRSSVTQVWRTSLVVPEINSENNRLGGRFQYNEREFLVSGPLGQDRQERRRRTESRPVYGGSSFGLRSWHPLRTRRSRFDILDSSPSKRVPFAGPYYRNYSSPTCDTCTFREVRLSPLLCPPLTTVRKRSWEKPPVCRPNEY